MGHDIFHVETETVRWLTAMQAQDHNGVLTSVALRTAEGTRHGVEQALNAGKIVKSWPSAAPCTWSRTEDLRWMLQLMTPRVIVGATARRAGLGLDTRTLERAREVAEDTLAGGHRLLPGFDELILGYQDRSCTLPAAHAERIVPGRNGVFRPTVLSDGQVVGTWQHTGRGARQTITTTPFTEFSPAVADALPRVYAVLP